ncbi:MAG TPA: fucose isomerase [Firmicutes bacterium]|nr:fucose isomerase [Bacillota bacterium]
MSQVTLGLIVGNRNFFPDSLCENGRAAVIKVLEQLGMKVIALSPEDTNLGTVETWEDAQKCAALFREHQDEIDGILVTLPNFGDERGVANTIRLSGLKVPVLVHAFADDVSKMDLAHRRDSFCGKISVCNNLRQYGIPFSLTSKHTLDPEDPAFAEDLKWFAAVCRVVKTLRGARVGAIGTRPANFNTVRYSEKLLEASGISVEPIDLSEVFGRVGQLSDSDEAVQARLRDIKDYVQTAGVPEVALMKMAKFAVVIDRWMKANDLIGTTIQCWTSIEEFFGIAPCAVMSMMSNSLLPSACEVDVMGLLSMLALQAASEKPSAIIDWNNNYGQDPDMLVAFHCSNFPKDMLEDAKMSYQDIVGGTVGNENAYGTIQGRVKPGPFTFARLSSDDICGKIRAYVGEGAFTDDALTTFGGYGVAKIPGLQCLMKHICSNGFEHHVAITQAQVACAVYEALSKYLGWDVYYHKG